MNLSARLIVWHLSKKYQLRSSGQLTSQPYLGYPVRYEPSRPVESGIIYVTDQPDFELPSHQLSQTLFILTGPFFSISETDYPNLCILPQADATPVLAFLNRLFHKYEEWNQSLFESRLKNASIQNLLDLTDSIIPNPTIVIGMDFTILAVKKNLFPNLPNPVLGSDDDSAKLVSALKQDPNYEAAYTKTGYFYYPGNEIASPSLCVNIRQQNRTAYRLIISEGEVPLDETFGFILEYLARMISHALSTNIAANHDYHPLHQIFSTLLTDPSADYVEISRQLTDFGWLSSHSYLCILIRTGALDYKNLTLRSICSYVENTIPASCAVAHRGNAVVYINLDLCTLSMDEISQKIAGFIRDSLLSAGYSRKLLGHFNFQRQYVQASIALQTGSRKHPTQWIHHFDDIALSYLLEQTTKKLPAYMLCHERLLQLKNKSEENHSQLYQTLRCYLENHQNITKTAQDLYIHRSTLLYRLEKIQDIVKADYSDPDEFLYLLLSFRLMDMEEHS